MNKGLTIILTGLLLLSFAQGITAQSAEYMQYSQLSCNELYVLTSQLEPNTQHFRSPLFNEKTDLIATAVGSVITIGYYYLGYSTGQEYFNNYRANQHLEHLDILRQHMAQKYCFQKF